ncbi:MAG: efflux RND transporter periplasmic adaptor subunit [Enterobacteriaceae bacterium]|jgi:Cu(I)/Ag(I) efflux system membrane fusion protein|nr:efflux RND transporter periplasmic adaptor subunit [Enterobacteriaceae bacterium]
MKLKTSILLAIVMIALIAGFLIGKSTSLPTSSMTAEKAQPNTASETGRKVLYWYDPMSPATRFDKPGKSPFMDMELVPRYADEGHDQDDGGVQISARQQQNLGVRTEKVTRRQITPQINAFGTVAIDERRVAIIPALASGLIEKLYVSAPQQFVQKDEALALLWIPQWAAAQQEYLAVRQLRDRTLTNAARARLQLQFMPDEIIQSVERSGKPQTKVTIRAPHEGYINKLDVRAGTQVNAAQSLFELAALDPVWIVIDYPENQAALLTVGSNMNASSNSFAGKVFHGKVSELLPNLDSATRTLKARVVLDNPDHLLKSGMYLTVNLSQNAPSTPVLAIPEEALIMSGAGNRVLVTDGDGYFRPVSVTAGRSQDGWIEISGLKEGQEVVTSGQFLIDSEASLRSALPQMSDKPAESSVPSVPTYAGHGVLKAIHADSVTISHDPIPELKWSAMTMDFNIDPKLVAQLKTGEQVMFTFSMDDSGVQIISIMPMDDQPISDHSSHNDPNEHSDHSSHKEQP